MIGISQLYARVATTADPLRYGRESSRLPAHLLRFSQDRKPVVVWNCSRRCNLRCIHCYADSANQRYPDELTAGEARTMIDDLAQFGVGPAGRRAPRASAALTPPRPDPCNRYAARGKRGGDEPQNDLSIRGQVVSESPDVFPGP